MEEIWKTIECRKNYEVSTSGNIRSKLTGKNIHQQKRKSGYVKVELWQDGKPLTKDVHRLVAEAFIPKIDGRNDVNHIDGNKSNNRLENLEWCTRKENMQHAMKNGLFVPDASRFPEPNKKPIRIIETGEVFDSISSCAKAIDSSVINISHAVRDDVPDHHSCKGLHFELISKAEYEKLKPKKKQFLYDYQMDAVKRMTNGSILNGGVGSGKSRTGLYYYFKEQGGSIDPDYVRMKNPKDLYIITTAMKRDKKEWVGELANYLISTTPEASLYSNKVVIDSWNNIKKYQDVTGAFFILDEQKVCGSGAWVKSFLKLTKNNDWILLSATVGDTWSDYIPVFIANGFYKNRTEFTREHVIYSRYTNFPKIDRYVNTGRLIRLRNKILIDMDFKRHTVSHHEDVYVKYDLPKYKEVGRTRWDPYKDEPIVNAGGLCYVWRKVVNSDESRQLAVEELADKHPRIIVFYNFDYERDILLHMQVIEGTEIAEWSGHAHQEIPDSERWIYLVQYTAGCEGWNSIKTDTIVFYSQNYSYKVMEQACGRINRLNTPYTDLYYYHIKSWSAIDMAIAKALKAKKNFNEGKFAQF